MPTTSKTVRPLMYDNRLRPKSLSAATLAFLLTACGSTSANVSDPTATDGADETQTGQDSQEPRSGWFSLGWGESEFDELRDGAEFRIVWGSQGSAMFPVGVRGGEFILPDDPRDYSDERAPLLDLNLDIDGYNTGIGGHFKRIANYPVTFDILDDGTYELIYIPVIVPDDIDPTELDGLDAYLWAQLTPFGAEPIVLEFNLNVVVDTQD